MRYYKDKNSEIYAYEDNEKPQQDGLTQIDKSKLDEILGRGEDEQARLVAELEAQIKECENYIRHALIIGNTAVLESLRAEYKELIAQREELRK